MNYTITITQEELLLLSEALGEMPFKKVAGLIPKLQQQINEQAQKSADSFSGSEANT